MATNPNLGLSFSSSSVVWSHPSASNRRKMSCGVIFISTPLSVPLLGIVPLHEGEHFLEHGPHCIVLDIRLFQFFIKEPLPQIYNPPKLFGPVWDDQQDIAQFYPVTRHCDGASSAPFHESGIDVAAVARIRVKRSHYGPGIGVL